MAEESNGNDAAAAGGGGADQPPATGGGRGSPPTPAAPKDEVLSLAQLIGAPITALVDAEARSAMATERFIRHVGFDGGEGPGELGDLKMAKFTRKRRDNDGVQEIDVQIPLLSMLPIPALQIRDAELDYTVRIVQTEIEQPPKRDDLNEPLGAPDRDPEARLRASFARAPQRGERRSTDMLVKMKVRIEQADMPDGLAKLLALSSDSIQQDVSPVIESGPDSDTE
ncbi:MAG: DUF2589 domain-containing protein [Pseudomonadota bacterium]